MSTPFPFRHVVASRRVAALALVAAVVPLAGCSRHHGSPPPAAAQPLTGRLYTTDALGAPVEGDLFAQACDVYLNGGPPEGTGEPGLPADDYYVQVTDATGAVLLSKEGPLNGVITVGGETPAPEGTFAAYEGEHDVIEATEDTGLRLALCPLEAASADGLYTVWLTPRDDYAPGEGRFGFREERSLVHAFALTGEVATAADLVVRRFCDRDADGSAEGETFLDDVRFMVSISSIDDGLPFEVRTGDTVPGEARIAGVPTPATFSVCELVPGTGVAGSWWYGTLPGFGASAGSAGTACYTGALDGDEDLTLLFGAACVRRATAGLRAVDFLSGGGKALLEDHDPAWRDLLDGAGLVTADGSAYDVPDGSFLSAFTSFASWISAPGSANEAHLLSREVAAALLATEYGQLEAGATHVLRPAGAACYGANTAMPAALVDEAQALIRNDGFTPEGDPHAVPQHCLRSLLAGINTNAWPLLSGHCCDAVYP